MYFDLYTSQEGGAPKVGGALQLLRKILTSPPFKAD